MRISRLFMPFFLMTLLSSKLMANPNCFLTAENERLTNYCLLENTRGKLLNENTMKLVVGRLQSEGYFGGLARSVITGAIYPDLYYSNNINGGNPNKTLVLGDLVFSGDPNLIAKSGMVVGINYVGSFRKTYAVGRYIDGKASVSLAFLPKRKLSFNSRNATLCSKNMVHKNIYTDFCATTSKLDKEITTDETKTLSMAVSKLAINKRGINEYKWSLIRRETHNYAQTQAHLTLNTIYNNNLATSLVLRIGQPIVDQLALKYGLEISASSMVFDRTWSFGVSHDYSDGGKLIGISCSDKTTNVAISTNLNKATKVSFGYSYRNSSIDYFDESFPTIRLTHQF